MLQEILSSFGIVLEYTIVSELLFVVINLKKYIVDDHVLNNIFVR